MVNKIYDQHNASFAKVEGYVITEKGGNDRLATVAFKFPEDGAGRLYCYLHLIGIPMVRGSATGYGYDKRSAAFEDATDKLGISNDHHIDTVKYTNLIIAFRKAGCVGNGGSNWDRALREAGYNVLQAI